MTDAGIDPFDEAPKAPAGKLVLAYRSYVETAFGATALLLAVAIAAVTLGDGDAALAIATVAGITGACALIVALSIWLSVSIQKRRLKGLREGRYYFHWTYDDATWQATLGAQSAKMGNLPVLMTGLFAFSGLILAIAFHVEALYIGGTVLSTYVVAVGGVAGLGWLLGVFFRWAGRRGVDFARRYPGEAYIGHDGLYITGQYCPWHAFGFNLIELRGDAEALVFTFEIWMGKQYQRKEVTVPVPAGREHEARAVLEHFGAAPPPA